MTHHLYPLSTSLSTTISFCAALARINAPLRIQWIWVKMMLVIQWRRRAWMNMREAGGGFERGQHQSGRTVEECEMERLSLQSASK